MSHSLTTALAVIVISATWIGVVLYSRHTYPLEGCAACGGTGRKWEPQWMAYLRFSRTRRFRLCPVCNGAARFNIHE
jgi:hypothetical protein